MKLTFSNGAGTINVGMGDFTVSSYSLPFLSDGIFYDDDKQIYFIYVGAGRSFMTEDQIAQVASYLQSIPQAPGVGYEWTSSGWQLPSTALQAAQSAKWEMIKSARDSKLDGGLTFNGSVYDSDPVSRAYIQGAVQLAQIALANNQPYSVSWTLANNSQVTLDGPAMIQLGVALGQFVQSVFSEGDSIRSQINAATTINAVNAISWT